MSVTPVIEEPVAVEESPTANTYSVSREFTPTHRELTNSLAEALNSPQVRSQCSSISLAQLGSRGSQRQTRSQARSCSTPCPALSSNCNNTPQLVAQGTPIAALPAGSISRVGSPTTLPTERTAYRLAKQLRNFQGCTHQQHAEAERQHQKHHMRPNVHSLCSSLIEITGLVSGTHNQGQALPDVLSSPKLMEQCALPEGLDLKAAFEGTSPAAYPEDAGTSNEKLPRSLCLQQHYHSSQKGRAAQVTFDIDSICCFPSSLAFARNGIEWYPWAHASLNLDADIHFSLSISAYNSRGNLTTRDVPLHKIPHYCFGTVAGSIRSLMVFIFFPELRLESQYKHSTHLSKQDQQLWLDAVLLPALGGLGLLASRMKYYPASGDNASLNVTATSKETHKIKETSREQLLPYSLPHEHLDQLWAAVHRRIAENPGLRRFNGATLFVNAKNTKLAYMKGVVDDLVSTYKSWEEAWAEAVDPQFCSRDRTFVDIAKEVTSEDYALPYDSVPNNFEAETFLWKRCCLEAYAHTRVKFLEDGKRARGSPSVATYPWATMRDTIGQTLSTALHGQENLDRLVYSQFYGTIKSPFDVSKVYVFDNQAIENLALDPGYIRSLQQQGGGSAFNERTCKESYKHSKQRVASSLQDNQRRSYGVREEHRVSLTMMDEICELWHEWDQDNIDVDSVRSPIPYYIVPSQELFGFLRAQINKYCFLFEHTLAHTARTYSLPETMVMVIALRALRFCYGSSMLNRESLLYKDRWDQMRERGPVVKEGLGMQETMANCGLGWFLPKINWVTRRVAQPHGDNILVGNLLMHAEYKRRWRAVKDLRDVSIRFNQATNWYQQHSVQQHPRLLEKWLEYLQVLIIEQFDADIWHSMLAAHKRRPELSPAALKQDGNIAFSYQGMRRMFLEGGVASPPHIVTGNKMRFSTVEKLLDFLFLWDDSQERAGWGNRSYRLILQKSFQFIDTQLGYERASGWLDKFFYLVRLTHWILPYPSDKALIVSTKASPRQKFNGRTMWFSAAFADPSQVSLPFKDQPTTLSRLISQAHQYCRPEVTLDQPWEGSALIKACRRQGLLMLGWDETEENWIAGRKSAGTKGFLPVWEQGFPPILLMREKI